MTPRETRAEALRQIEYVMSMSIELLHDLNRSRLQIKTLKDTDSGNIVVYPESIDTLYHAVETVQRTCLNIKPIKKKQIV